MNKDRKIWKVVCNFPISVDKRYSLNELRTRGAVHYRHLGLGGDYSDYLVVKYVKHNLTNYDKVMDDFRSQDVSWEIRNLFNVKVLEAIGIAYPELHDECVKQIFASASKTKAIEKHRLKR